MKTIRTLILAGSLALGAMSCSKSTPPAEAPTTTAAAPAALTAIFQAVPKPEPLVAIPDLRRSVSSGDQVVIEAKVMGVMDPFVENRALVVVGDEGTITSCDLLPEDQCSSPWDACCEDPKILKAGTATIQVVDESGQVLRHGLRDINGLKELSRVRVSGTVSDQGGDALIINATSIELL